MATGLLPRRKLAATDMTDSPCRAANAERLAVADATSIDAMVVLSELPRVDDEEPKPTSNELKKAAYQGRQVGQAAAK